MAYSPIFAEDQGNMRPSLSRKNRITPLPVEVELVDMPWMSSISEMKGQCMVCESADIVPVISLPNLPITGRFIRNRTASVPQGVDQEFLMCLQCGHGQLKVHIPPDELYRSNYGFRTSRADSAMEGVRFFLECLRMQTSGQRFQTVLDVGCNDLYLLEQMSHLAVKRVGIDPIWMGQESPPSLDIQVVGSYLEDIDIGVLTAMMPDLVVCRHVLEHVSNPGEALRRVVTTAASDALFLIEVPCLDALVTKYRFDQVFHQHLQYYSLHSLLELVQQAGGEYLRHWNNYHHWGSVVLAFKKRRTGRKISSAGLPLMWSVGDVQEHFASFQKQCAISREVLEDNSLGSRYGYGASPMLPTLAYHLQSDLSCLKAVLDDDQSKHDWFYENLPVPIDAPYNVRDWTEATVLITAPEGVNNILSRCRQYQPKHVLYPLPFIS